MGFLRNYALRVDNERRKREALTAFYKASSDVLFLESKEGQVLSTPERLAKAKEHEKELRRYLSNEFGVDNP